MALLHNVPGSLLKGEFNKPFKSHINSRSPFEPVFAFLVDILLSSQRRSPYHAPKPNEYPSASMPLSEMESRTALESPRPGCVPGCSKDEEEHLEVCHVPT